MLFPGGGLTIHSSRRLRRGLIQALGVTALASACQSANDSLSVGMRPALSRIMRTNGSAAARRTSFSARKLSASSACSINRLSSPDREKSEELRVGKEGERK